MLFDNKNKKMSRFVNAMQNFRPTSKYALKQFCLTATDLDLTEAEKLYAFLAEGLENLPDFDPLPPTFMDRTKTTLNEIFSILNDHKSELGQGYSILQAVMAKKGTVLPDLGGTVSESLPPING
jgi:hypothetical protein